MKITCGECALYIPQSQICQLYNERRDRKNSCTNGRKELFYCNLCKRPTLDYFIDITDDNAVKILCSNCKNQLSTCNTCNHRYSCAFETDPCAYPKVVRKTIQQGPMQIQTDVKNPDRIQATCAKGCPCFIEGQCQRENSYCPNYEFVYPEE